MRPYTLPDGQRADDSVYSSCPANLFYKGGQRRVIEYGENGTDAEIIVYKKRHIGKAGGGQNASRFRFPAPL